MDAQARGKAIHAAIYADFGSLISTLATHFYVPPRTAVLWGRRAHDMQIGSSQYRHYHTRLAGKTTAPSRALAMASLVIRRIIQTRQDQTLYGFSVVENGKRVDPRAIRASS